MANISSRDELVDYSLRRLGEPVIEINVDRQQCSDRVDEALELFAERHFDGAERAYFSHQITQEDKDNKYIDTSALGPTNGPTGDGPTGKDILTVVQVFQFGTFANINMFDVRYQMALHDYFGINRGLGANSSMGLAKYDSTKRHINMIQDFFDPEKLIRFNKVTDRLHIDTTKNDLQVGKYVIIEAYVAIPFGTFTQVFNDIWLKKYTTALIKKQWGSNMSKFDGIQLPGGVSMRGEAISQEADTEIQLLEERLQTEYELPIDFMTG
jgi:hypothetical protein